MEEYFFIDGKNKLGPFTLSELKEKQLSENTYIWTNGMNEWRKIKDLPDLYAHISRKDTTPPLPQEILEGFDINDNIINENINKGHSLQKDEIKKNNSLRTFFLIWTAFHLFALFTSMSNIKPFNNKHSHETSKFWPNVKYSETYYHPWIEKKPMHKDFWGVFVEYDFTEFLAYVGAPLVLYLIVRASKNEKKDAA